MAANVSQKINVLEVHSSLAYAGGARNMVATAIHLRKDVFDVAVGLYQAGGPLEQRLVDASIPVIIGNGRIEPLLEYIVKRPITILHIHRSGGSVPLETRLIREAKRLRPNLIIVEKNVFGKYDPSVEGLIDCSFFQSMMHVNERYLPSSGKKFDFEKMKVLYNMVDVVEFEKYRATPAQIQSLRNEIGIDSNDFVVGKVARPAIEKWSDLTIECAPYLAKNFPSAKILIVGCPQSRQRRIAKSRYHDMFRILPETTDQSRLHLIYQAMDMLGHTSKIGECNGNTINEAMFWKKPVVVNSTPHKDNGQLEQVIHGQNGFVANTPFTMARAIMYLGSHSKERRLLGEQAHAQVITLNVASRITAQLEKFFLEYIHAKIPELTLPTLIEYATIGYYPGKEDIAQYSEEYKKRLTWEFGSVQRFERLCLWARIPPRMYYKLRDFVEHKWRSYGR